MTRTLVSTAGLHDLLEQRLSVDSPNPVAKATCVIGGMLGGADSIDDLDLLRHGGMGRRFGGLRALTGVFVAGLLAWTWPSTASAPTATTSLEPSCAWSTSP